MSMDRFNLGPGAGGGEYHEISCAGMDSVTSTFNKYDLSEICSEYISQADPNHSCSTTTQVCGGF